MMKAVAALALILAAAGPAQAQSLDEVVRDVETAYGRITDLRAEFTVRFLNPAQPKDAEGNWVLDLTPKQPLPTLSRLILSLEPRGWEARKAIVHDQFDNTVTMKFTKMVVNSGLPERTFTFVAPKGVAIVPLR